MSDDQAENKDGTQQQEESHLIGVCKWCNKEVFDPEGWIIPREVKLFLCKDCWQKHSKIIIDEWG